MHWIDPPKELSARMPVAPRWETLINAQLNEKWVDDLVKIWVSKGSVSVKILAKIQSNLWEGYSSSD